jgi:hypothetical protein
LRGQTLSSRIGEHETPVSAQEILQAVDHDGDGKVSFEEFVMDGAGDEVPHASLLTPRTNRTHISPRPRTNRTRASHPLCAIPSLMRFPCVPMDSRAPRHGATTAVSPARARAQEYEEDPTELSLEDITS